MKLLQILNEFNMLGQEILNKKLSSNEEVLYLSSITYGNCIARVSLKNNTQEQFKF